MDHGRKRHERVRLPADAVGHLVEGDGVVGEAAVARDQPANLAEDLDEAGAIDDVGKIGRQQRRVVIGKVAGVPLQCARETAGLDRQRQDEQNALVLAAEDDHRLRPGRCADMLPPQRVPVVALEDRAIGGFLEPPPFSLHRLKVLVERQGDLAPRRARRGDHAGDRRGLHRNPRVEQDFRRRRQRHEFSPVYARGENTASFVLRSSK